MLSIRPKTESLQNGVNSKFLENKLPNIRDSSHSTENSANSEVKIKWNKNSSSEKVRIF